MYSSIYIITIYIYICIHIHTNIYSTRVCIYILLYTAIAVKDATSDQFQGHIRHILWLVDTSDILKGLPLTTRTTDRGRGCGCKRSQVTRFVIVRFEQKERKARLDNSPLSHACLWVEYEWMMCVNFFFFKLVCYTFSSSKFQALQFGPLLSLATLSWMFL